MALSQVSDPRFKRSSLHMSILCICLGINSASHAEQSNEPNQTEYVFDTNMFRGSSLNQKKLERLSQNQTILAGTYKVDVYLNQRFIQNTEIRFVEHQDNAIACFTPDQLKKMSILVLSDAQLDAQGCASLETLVGTGKLDFDPALLRVNLHIPQSHLQQMPRGYVAPENWSKGDTMAFINYSANYYHNNFQDTTSSHSTDSAFVSLNGGINLGNWQYRQQSNLSHQNGETEWNNIRSYLKRPIPSIQSEISLGQLNSSGQFFSGLSYNGINLSSDDRMLPDSQRGYAPVIQGQAQTMARVSVKQNGREIYQTSVAPGPFKISDLYPTSYNGDLEVTIFESDGQQTMFTVPFSAVPESVRAGAFKYNLDLGQTRDIGEDTYFGNITTQYGINNAITLNSGLRFAEDYQAAVIGTAFTNHWGAFGTDMTYSRAELPQQGIENGWMFGLNYSKNVVATNTNFALAGYRFSTEGYRDLSDVLSLREHSNEQNQNTDFHPQRSRFTASINQRLGDYGNLTLSGSAQSYRDDRDDDYQLQLGYGTTFQNGASMNINVSRQVYSTNEEQSNKPETFFGLSLNFPTSKNKPRAPDVGLSYNHSPDSDSYQANISGMLDQANTMNYNLGATYETETDQTVLNASLQKRFSNANTNVSLSYGEDSWQASGSIQGAVALHSGGVTFGPYLGDTFALIEAPGAEGAKVSSVYGTRINKQGYALVPALTPYRYNSVALNPEGMSGDVDLDMGEQKIAPVSGASVKVKFKTLQGKALIIQSKFSDGSALPLGADVLDHQDNVIAVVGQNSQIYLRAEQPQGIIRVVWGDDANEQCKISYDIQHAEVSEHLTRMTQTCLTGE